MSKEVEIAYDQVITTDRPTGANRPDLLIREKKPGGCILLTFLVRVMLM